LKQNSFIVKDAFRKRERDLKESLKKDLVSYISEILTNADDSYRRLENTGFIPRDEIKVILIEIKEDRRKKGEFVVSITDQAEGMSEDELRKKFKDYGADKAEGQLHTRGLFGQGASDVLFNAASEQRTAMIESIKDGKLTKARFNYNKNSSNLKEVEFDPIQLKGSQFENMRQALGIFQNGTKVTFGIPKRVRYNPRTLVEEIQSYPFFKFLLMSKNRKIILKQEGELVETKLTSEAYQLIEKPLLKKDFELIYKNYKLKSTLTLWSIDKKLIKHDILVIDEHQIIYDNHFFGYDTQPKAKNLTGFLEIKDLYKVLRDELNAEDPIAIITDNRKGFDTSQDFYQILKSQIVKIINPKLDQIGEDISEVDITANKKINELLKKLNTYFIKNMPEEIPYSGKEKGIYPPEEGLAFVRNEMSLTVSKKYMIVLLINSRLISDVETIKLRTEDSDIIGISQIEVSFKKEEENPFGLVKKTFLIEAKKFSNTATKIIAESKTHSCQALIRTIEYEIHYPIDGIEFYPNRMRHKPGKNHIGNLYVDKAFFKTTETILIRSDEPYVIIDNSAIHLNESDFVNSGIAVFKINFSGGELGDRFKVIATIEKTSANLNVEIKEPSKRENDGNLGLISSIKFHSDYENIHEQARYTKTDKVLLINRVNPINKTMLSNINFLKDMNTISLKQLNYLLDLCAFHGALQILEYQIVHGDFVFNKNDFLQFEKKLYQVKTEIFELIKNEEA
jgi:hypothetical protein